ncbi:Pentatricopeptide repeat-containing protein [Capsicum annuum]|uniref:Pentatricopeptide repeat-containing protein n=1 Tax=Capsicum annuum TaxID=4072 RepID=A0A2G2ZP95_CAPAN|nr:Pentatricopeptide repeat-containing protein [Capsicum annuum]PHT83810.1 Pentatricopeptide repeat-containing protein [Capsicum annuum]
MRKSGVQQEKTTMVVLLSSWTELGDLSLGKWIYGQVIEQGMFVNYQLTTSLVDMHANCGTEDYAHLMLDRIGERNVWTWSTMILGLAQYAFAAQALELFWKMKDCSVKPNYVSFLGELFAYSHVGMVEEGHHLFQEMESVYRIKPMVAHYGAMVGILSRAGRLEEAHKFIVHMPIKADAVIWRTLLSACHIHDISNYTRVGEEVRRRLLRMEPERNGNLVVVANKYTGYILWEKASKLKRVNIDAVVFRKSSSAVGFSKLSGRGADKDGLGLECGMVFALFELVEAAIDEDPSVPNDLSDFVGVRSYGHFTESYRNCPGATDDPTDRQGCDGPSLKLLPLRQCGLILANVQ